MRLTTVGFFVPVPQRPVPQCGLPGSLPSLPPVGSLPPLPPSSPALRCPVVPPERILPKRTHTKSNFPNVDCISGSLLTISVQKLMSNPVVVVS